MQPRSEVSFQNETHGLVTGYFYQRAKSQIVVMRHNILECTY